MRLESEFYRNFFTKLSEQTKPSLSPAAGWGASAELTELMKKLYEDANVRHVFIIEKTGKQSASYGDLGYIDTTDLVSLVVCKMLACEAMAELFESQRFSAVSVEGRRWGAHLSMLGKVAILMVIFDQQTNADLVRKRVRRAYDELEAALKVC